MYLGVNFALFTPAIVCEVMIIEAAWPAFLTLILFALLMIPIVIRFLKRRFDLFETAIWVIIIYSWCYVLRPAYMIITHTGHMYLSLDETERDRLLVLALGYSILGIIFFFAGYRLPLCKLISRRLPYPAPLWDKRAANIVVFLFTIVGAAASIIYINANGGFIFYVTHINWFRGESLNIRLAFLAWGFDLFPIASCILLLTVLYSRRQLALYTLIFIAYIFGCTIMLSLLGGRALVVSYWLMAALLFHYSKRQLRLSYILLVLPLIFLYIAVGGLIREQLFSVPDRNISTLPEIFLRVSFLAESMFGKFVNSPDADAMDVFMALLRGVPSEFPFQYGKQFLDLLKALVPAGLLPVSRESFRVYLLGEQIRNVWWPWYGGGTPPSILGFLYLNFHIFGIAIGMFILGLFSKIVYSYFRHNHENKGVMLFYSLTLFQFIIGMIRGGDLVNVGHGYIIKFLFTLVALRLITHGRFIRRRLL